MTPDPPSTPTGRIPRKDDQRRHDARAVDPARAGVIEAPDTRRPLLPVGEREDRWW